MISYKAITTALAVVLLGLLGWAGSAFYTRLVTIQKDLNELQLQVARLQASLVSRDEMRQMVSDEVERQMARERAARP